MEIGAGANGVLNGRDHNPFGFTMWLAGGGIKGGTIYGATNEFGFKAVEKPVQRPPFPARGRLWQRHYRHHCLPPAASS
jgi:hypothetical protein